MQPRTRALLQDALSSGQRIQRILGNHTRATYIDDEDTQLLIERCFEIIGEAIRVLDAINAPELARITEYRTIIALRNVIAHQYAVIRPDRIWQIAHDSLPVTLEEIRAILQSDPE